MRRPVHAGQNPLPLQLNATSRLSSHLAHQSRAKPRHKKHKSFNFAQLKADIGDVAS
jgi:hypothetical protein